MFNGNEEWFPIVIWVTEGHDAEVFLSMQSTYTCFVKGWLTICDECYGAQRSMEESESVQWGRWWRLAATEAAVSGARRGPSPLPHPLLTFPFLPALILFLKI